MFGWFALNPRVMVLDCTAIGLITLVLEVTGSIGPIKIETLRVRGFLVTSFRRDVRVGET